MISPRTTLAPMGLVVLYLGCGAPDSKAGTPESTASPTASSASAVATTPAASGARASGSASVAPGAGAVVAFPKWKKYAGPKGRFPLSAAYGQPAGDSPLSLWVVRPTSVEWEPGLSFTLATFEHGDGDDYVVKTTIFPEHGFPGDEHLTVPGALVCEPSTNAKLKKGDVVLVSMAATTSDYARVIGPEPDSEGAVRIGTHWVSADERVAVASELLQIQDKPTCGQRVRFKNAAGDELRWMQLVRVTGDTAWGLGFVEGHFDTVLVSVPAKDITPIPMTKTYAPKAKVMVATANHTLLAGQVTDVVDKGLAYHVKLDDGNDSNFDFEDVTDPVPGWPKK